MSNPLITILAVACITLAIFLFFKNTYQVLLNNVIRRYWSQAEKCYINFELMFLDEKFTLARCKLLVLGSMVTCAAIGVYFSRSASSYIPLFCLFLGMIFGWIFPGIFTSFLHKRYVSQFDSQLIDALGMMGSGLRSGLSLQQSIGLVSSEMPTPISQEFKLMMSEHSYGKTLDEAFERIVKRVPSVDLGVTIESILILRSTGGNLVETFEIIMDTVRERKKVEGKIKSMTAMGVFQGFIVGSMPFIMMFILNLLNPEYMAPLYNTKLGWAMIVAVVILVTLGGLAIKSIVTIDV